MSVQNIILFGAGGHAKVVADCFKTIFGIVDDNSSAVGFNKIQFLGTYKSDQNIDCQYIVCIGDNKIRKKIVEKITHQFEVAIHHSAIVSPFSAIGIGSMILQRAVINSHTIIGKHCIINSGSIVEHDCMISDFVHIASNSTICGHVTIGENTFIGAGSVIIPLIQIGKNCVIGAGSVVLENIPDNAVVVGNPGKIIKFIES